jgi:quercetin dioxygenase-like cupin family protein
MSFARRYLKCLSVGLSMQRGNRTRLFMPASHGFDAAMRLESEASGSDKRGTGSGHPPRLGILDLATYRSPQMNIRTMTAAAIALAAPLAFTSPALAGDCPSGKEMANALAGHPTMPKDVTDTVIGAIDLGPEIGVEGRQLRTRRLVVQPGGVVPFHSHMDRPALIITISGQVTEYRSTCAVGITHHAGEIAREAEGISHWWRNEGTEPAVLLSSDVFHMP